MIYTKTNSYELHLGKMQDELKTLNENSIDCIVTDPPYELGFMGKSWDNSGVAFQRETWEHCFRVLKPGAYLLAFGGTRTFHRIACAIEDAGFEIRDTIMWLYGSGFPKSMNIGLAIDKKNGVESEIIGFADTTMPDFRDVGKKQKEISGIDKLTFGQIENSARKEQPIYKAQNEWDGWGTQLKPAYEPIIVARKPFKGSLVDNVIEYGVGGINIDECRVGTETISTHNAPAGTFAGGPENRGSDTSSYKDHIGRFPANIITDGSDEVSQGFPISGSGNNNGKVFNYAGKEYHNSDTSMFNGDKPQAPSNYNDAGSAMRYFYCAKASKKDRDEGLDEFEEKKVYGEDMNWGYGNNNGDNFGDRIANVSRKNTHPTVKPTELMQYLIRLVAPKNAIILDPFMGSGSTGKAVMFENKERNTNYKFIGIEMTEEYLPICEARIKFAIGYNEPVIIESSKEKLYVKTPSYNKCELF